MRRFMLGLVALLALSLAAHALQPSELTPKEAAVYNSLRGKPEAQKSFLSTRGFYRLCLDQRNGKLPALQLPRQPPDYDSDYVTDAEQKIVDDAVLAYVTARIRGSGFFNSK